MKTYVDAAGVLLVALLCVGLACRTTPDGPKAREDPQPNPQPPEPSLIEQAQARYGDDLQLGPFVILMDFEPPEGADAGWLPAGCRAASEAQALGLAPDEPTEPDPSPAEPADQPAEEPAEAAIPPAEGPPTLALSPVAATGGRSLAWRVAQPGDAVRLGNLRLSDWTQHSLLTLNVLADEPTARGGLDPLGPPKPLGAVVIEISSQNDPRGRRFRSEAFPLEPGWRRIRLDLARVAKSCPLDDVGSVWLIWAPTLTPLRTLEPLDAHPRKPRSLAIADSRSPRLPGDPPEVTRLLIDDVILADNALRVHGPAGEGAAPAPPGATFARWRGQQLEVGVGGSFLLRLHGGVVTSLVDLADDRQPDLAAPLGLGPHVLPISAAVLGVDPATQREQLDPAKLIVTPNPAAPWVGPWTQLDHEMRLTEANGLRLVVESTHRLRAARPRLGDPEPAVAEDALLARHVIYADGRVHTALRPPVTPGPWNELGCCAAWLVSPELAQVGIAATKSGPRGDGPAWCWRWPTPQGNPRRLGLMVASGAVQPMVLQAGDVAPVHSLWSRARSLQPQALALIWRLTRPPHEPEAGATLAEALTAPMLVVARVGVLELGAAWDADRDGFAELEGVYNLRLAGRQLQATFDAGGLAREGVVVRAFGVPPGAELRDPALVTVDGLPVPASSLARDAAGELLIRLPRPVLTLAELAVRVRESSPVP